MGWIKRVFSLGDDDGEQLVEEATEHLRKAAKKRKGNGGNDEEGRKK